MDPAIQRKYALEGAREALERTIKATESRLQDLKQKCERIQETIFMGFDADSFGPQTMVADDDQSVLLTMDTNKARHYIYKRQLRLEGQILEVAEKLEQLKRELASLRSG